MKSLLLFPEDPPLPVKLIYLPKCRGGDAEVVESGVEEGWWRRTCISKLTSMSDARNAHWSIGHETHRFSWEERDKDYPGPCR